MSRFLTQILVSCFGLTLALPQGWCCMEPNQCVGGQPTPKSESCCGNCGKANQDEPKPSDPQPSQPVRCWCKFDTVTSAKSDTDTAAWIQPVAHAGSVFEPSPELSPFLHLAEPYTPSHSLQIRLCLWRC